MKAFCVAVHPDTNYSIEFLVFEETAIRAVHKLNYNLRGEKAALQEQYPDDGCGEVRRLSKIINTIRRIGRKHKDRFGACHLTTIDVHELPEQPVYGVAYFRLGSRIGYVSNLLPKISLSAAQDSQR